jgi:hypothetical protein
MPRQNLISAQIEDSSITDAIENIKAIQSKFPFLINLSAQERKTFRKMGPKSVDYVNDNQVGAKQFLSSLPTDFPHDEFSKDVALINKLYPLLVASQALTEGLNDTILALGSDAMKGADEVYSFLKFAAKKDANAKELVQQIGRRFKRETTTKPK